MIVKSLRVRYWPEGLQLLAATEATRISTYTLDGIEGYMIEHLDQTRTRVLGRQHIPSSNIIRADLDGDPPEAKGTDAPASPKRK